jgi:hypothetical protein
MGGNAFPHLDLVRVHRKHLPATVHHVVNTLALPGFTVDYAMAHLMGSAGKQDTSGDLDFAVNDRQVMFVGQEVRPVFDLREFAARLREVLPEGHVNSKGLKGGQVMSAWPVAGNPALGYVQVDFVAGDPDWLMFSHWSAGLDRSPYKGVMTSTFLAVVAKLHKDFELFSDGSFNLGSGQYLPGEGPERVARVGLHMDLEHGLHRVWQVQKKPGQGLSRVTADEFETRVFQAPRFARLGYLTEPEAVLSLLFGEPTVHNEVDTFETLVAKARKCFPDRFDELKERFLESFGKSAKQNGYDLEEVANAAVWQA